MKDLYINLRTYSDYSIGESIIKIPSLIKHCVNNKIPAIALTDKNNLFGSLDFSIEAKNHGVQPIIGVDLQISGLFQKIQNKKTEILLLAKNRAGYENLLKLVSKYYTNNNAHCSLTLEDLLENSEGLILLIGNAVVSNFGEQNAKDCILNLLHTFKENLFLEFSRDKKINLQIEAFLKDLAIRYSIPIVATNKTQYIEKESQDALDALICISHGKFLLEENREKAGKENYLKSSEEMCRLFSDIPEAIQNTVLIAKKCSFLLEENKKVFLPKYLNSSIEEEQELVRIARAGLSKKINDYDEKEKYFKRLENELAIINNMKFAGYFLIVADFVSWSKKNGIAVGPGRGSGVGSITAWSIDITEVDPIKFGLLFERFLNPERISMPDFDIDFCQTRRDEVIEYVRKKFGKDRVAQIITFGKLQARAALRDVGRVLQIPYSKVDEVCKMIPNNPANPINLKQALDMDKKFIKEADHNSSIKNWIKISLLLEGMNRNISTHAAGIVISDRPLINVVPIYKDPNLDMPIVQYSLKYVEKIGLLKFDFLGLKTVSLIENTVNLIGKKDLFYDKSFSDKKTYEMLSKGNTTGVFQFESSGMKDVIKKIQPDNINDLVALGSLYRPGPMDNIPKYINRKHNKEKANYLHPELEQILKETYGIIVYQEQVMKIAQLLANYTLGEADLLRRAMGKKIKSEMESQRNKFILGCQENGIAINKAREIFDLVNKFASYGFNKSHAVAYAYLSYKTAFLKANYTVEFLVISMNFDIDNTDKIFSFINEAKIFNIEILPPCIQRSHVNFSIENKKIRFGLAAIKNVGKNIPENLKYKNDLFSLLSAKIFNKKILENLIKSGAFDIFGFTRKTLMMNIDRLVKYSSASSSNNNITPSLFNNIGATTISLENFPEYKRKEKLQYEFDSLGFYLSENPLEQYNYILAPLNLTKSTEIHSNMKKGDNIIYIAGTLISKKIRSTIHGKYAFIQIVDLHGVIDAAIFDEKLLSEKQIYLKEGELLFCKINAKNTNNRSRLIVQDVKKIDQAILEKHITAYIEINNKTQIEFLKKYIKYTDANDNTYVYLNIYLNVQNKGLIKFAHKDQKKIVLEKKHLEFINNKNIKLTFITSSPSTIVF